MELCGQEDVEDSGMSAPYRSVSVMATWPGSWVEKLYSCPSLNSLLSA